LADPQKRKTLVIVLGGIVLLLFLLLGAMNAFNVPNLRPHGTGQIFLFTALSIIIFLLFVLTLVLLSRNILKLFADERSRVLGLRLRSRMLIGAVLLSVAPAVFMFMFSYLLMNRSIERWFSQPSSDLREESMHIAMQLAQYATANARTEAESVASSEAMHRDLANVDDDGILADLSAHRITLEGGFAIVYREGQPIISFQVPLMSGAVILHPWLDEQLTSSTKAPLEERVPPDTPLTVTLLAAAQRVDQPIVSVGAAEYAMGTATGPRNSIIVVGLPMPPSLTAAVERIRVGSHDYWTLFRTRNYIRTTYSLLLLVLTALVFFISSYLAMFLSKQITRPVEALADAMDEIAAGRYKHRVTVEATEELGELIRAFNHMAADLEHSRQLAETSTTQLSAANLTLKERRRELETILETIPNGVVTLDPDLGIIQANRTFHDLIDAEKDADLTGVQVDDLFPSEIAEELHRLVRRSLRMGGAAAEFEMRTPKGMLNLSATVASLELQDGRHGCILVLEDVTDVLHAQRQVAWKEVAQRVAHEIKNPLTPIALSAERIRKHIDRSTPDSPAIIRKCSEVILGSVESMRVLVDQFAALAQFPTAQPTSTDLNMIVENALMLFSGRLGGIRVERRLDAGIPPVMADAEAMKRALANLIDNAAEAMQGSLVKILTVETCLLENHTAAEVVFSDTGHGLTDDMRERLFLPYVSTKQRGTGLGLAIAAKIVQEHGGAIRAERNNPVGARFIVELPLANGSNLLGLSLNGDAHANGNGNNVAASFATAASKDSRSAS
jgi:hypothetical protein